MRIPAAAVAVSAILPCSGCITTNDGPVQSDPDVAGTASGQIVQRPETTGDGAVTAWLESRAIRLDSLVAGSGFRDLQRLEPVLRDVRIVGLGASTHGTREFFQLKHRMLEFLVREMGFTVFAIEENYTAGLQINDYVAGGDADRASVIESLNYIWRTEEMLSLIDWMRRYNQSVPEARKLKFYGFDIQDNDGPARVVIDYLRRVAPGRAERAKQLNDALEKLSKPSNSADLQARVFDLLSQWREVLRYLVLNEAAFGRRTSAVEYENALQHLRLLIQYTDNLPAPFSYLKRDRYMTDNIRYILDQEGEGARIMVWAHNRHILHASGNTSAGPVASMGHWLREAFGLAYYAFGFAFGEGSFRAYDPSTDRFIEYESGPPPGGSLDWYLARPGIGDYVIDLRRPPENEEVRHWLVSTHGMRNAGFTVPVDIEALWQAGERLVPTTPGKQFDGLMFIDRTTPARSTTTKSGSACRESVSLHIR